MVVTILKTTFLKSQPRVITYRDYRLFELLMLIPIRNFCRRLYKRENKKCFNSLNLNKITDNKVFWKTVKPLLSDTSINTTRIFLINGNKMITEDPQKLQIL